MHYYPPNEVRPELNKAIFDYKTNPEDLTEIAKQQIRQPVGILRKVQHNATYGDTMYSVMCTRFSQDDKYMAAGYGDGVTRIYNLTSGKLSFTL